MVWTDEVQADKLTPFTGIGDFGLFGWNSRKSGLMTVLRTD
uniref:Uncharacterized protein n=1 Tax=Candidatus Nitrotoga fabula TaxID=2182327 RepID=A0A2X0QY62_9PROT|nr:protein of unknown function [Candidatus Nitrotoga fabula]